MRHHFVIPTRYSYLDPFIITILKYKFFQSYLPALVESVAAAGVAGAAAVTVSGNAVA